MGNWDYILKQQGMFAYTHITPEQTKDLREKHAVYMLDMGRISVCGLTEANIDHVGKALKDVIQN